MDGVGARRWYLIGTMLVVISFSVGCEITRAELESSRVSHDSAGVRIINSLEAVWGKKGGLAPGDAPRFRIGAAMGEEPYAFLGPLHAVRLRSGTIVVLDEGLDEVRWFDPSGGHLRTRGGPGEGPGEFVHPNRILRVPGDSVLVHDEAHPRLTLFDSEGTLVRTWDLEPPPSEIAGRINYFRPAPFGRLRDGRTVHLASWAGNEPGHNRRTAVVLAHDTSGRWLGPLVEFPGGDWWVERIEGGRRSTQNLGDRSAHAASDGELIYVGNGDDYRIRVHGSGGDLLRIFGRSARPSPANHAQIDSFLARARASTGRVPPDQMPEFERRLGEMESRLEDHLSHYQTMPSFQGLAVDPVGRLWVRTGLWTFSYDVFESGGTWLGSMTLPGQPLFLGETEVLVEGTDSLGAPFLELYPLVSQ